MAAPAVRGARRLPQPPEALVHHLHRLDGRVQLAGVAHHVRVGEVHQDEVVLAASRWPARARPSPRARSSPASGRTSSRRAARAPGAGPRPGNGTSRPPLKKKVTCAYFSVSARAELARGPLRQQLGEDLVSAARARRPPAGRRSHRTGSCRRSCPSAQPAAVELLEARVRRSARVSSRARSARKLKKTTTSPSRDAAHRRAVAVGHDRGLHELVRHLLRVRGADRRQRVRGLARPAPRTMRLVGELARGPSACRGPWRSSARITVAMRAAPSRARKRSSSST